MTTIHETCGCGATFDYQGASPIAASNAWRKEHRCSLIEPGVCFDDPGVTWPNGDHPHCELRAGHAGAHECSRGAMGGQAVWTKEEDA